MNPRKWLYQTPEQILIKASNGASDFGNKFGQPLICGSLLTFEHAENDKKFAYDKVIMLAGGVGFAKQKDSLKGDPEPGEKVIVMGGDNYRIGMGGGAVSSVETGQYSNAIELNAVQRANPEMQKRVSNVIRTLAESDNNPIVSIHDHGAGGHLNCLSELVEATGGKIDMDKLPIGDPTLSDKEIIGNESQERMGFLVKEKDIDLIQRIADRERAPMYVVGETTGDMQFVFQRANGDQPINLRLDYMIGKPPRTVITDNTVEEKYAAVETDDKKIQTYINDVLQLESVACKDWLTNKVDRSVTGKIARQQCAGELQLPLNDLGAVASVWSHYYRPDWDLLLSADVNYNDRWLFHLEGQLLSKMEADGGDELPMRYGINAEVEYRHNRALSFFLKMDNLAFQRYYYWANYPSQKGLFILGLTYTIPHK